MACTKYQISVFYVLYCGLEIILFAGTIFGWHSLNYVLKKEGYFAYLCPKNTTLLQQDYSNMSNATPIIMTTESVHMISNRTEEIVVCDPQDSAFNLIFTLSVCITGASVFFCGFLFDKFGTRFCRYISLCCALVSYPMVAFSTPDTSVLLYPGLLLFSFGSYLVLLTNLQIASLIPAKRSMFMCVMTGSFDASSSVFVLLKFGYARGFSIQNFFLILFVLNIVMVGISTNLFHPKFHIKSPLPPGYEPLSISRYIKLRRERQKPAEAGETLSKNEEELIQRPMITITKDKQCNSAENVGNVSSGPKNKFLLNVQGERNLIVRSMDRLHTLKNSTTLEKALSLQSLQDFADVPIERHKSEELGTRNGVAAAENNHAECRKSLESVAKDDSDKEPSFKEILLSPLYMLDLFWVSVLRLRSWFFMGAFNPMMTFMAQGDDAIVSHYTSVFAIMQFFGFIFAPMSGRLMDRKSRTVEDDPRMKKIARLEMCIPSFGLNSVISVLMSVGAIIPIIEVQYATCALHILQRAFLYGPNSAFIAQMYPLKHFGKLFGMYMTVSSIFSFVQFPMFTLMKGQFGGNPYVMNLVLLVLMVLSFIHPIYIWWYCRSSRMNFKKNEAGKR